MINIKPKYILFVFIIISIFVIKTRLDEKKKRILKKEIIRLFHNILCSILDRNISKAVLFQFFLYQEMSMFRNLL